MNKTKCSIIGFLAGALSFLTLALVIYLGLAIFALFFTLPKLFIEAKVTDTLPANDSTLELIWGSLVGSLQNLFMGLWEIRLGFLIGGFLGLIAAWIYQIVRIVRVERAGLASFIGLAIVTSTWFITWAYILREETALRLAESPELYSWRELLLGSFTNIFVVLIFGLTLTYPFWAVWQWWYRLLTHWQLSPRSESGLRPSSDLLPTALGEHVSYATHLHELKLARATGVGLAPAQSEVILQTSPTTTPLLSETFRKKPMILLTTLLLCCLILLFFCYRYHSGVALRLQHGKVFLERDGEGGHRQFLIQIEPDIQRIRVVNINGTGRVSLYLSPSTDYQEAVTRVSDWPFKWRDDEYLYVDVPLVSLKPGHYYLHFVQKAGWGYFEYTVSHGGGVRSQTAALVIGLLLACSVILGLALVLLGWGWLASTIYAFRPHS